MDDMKFMNVLLLSISFSLFGMLLIFGLGFVFPTINPYVVIKWIIIVCAVVFAYAVLSCLARCLTVFKKRFKKGGKK
ncbi:MAG: hypothetical protein NTZ07_03540 [Candidatus Woesebacteria bacterium]|jgi:hypothetical protein|nr:hypothetical protein [Candidatus Woesebacteria bacterium]